MKYQYIVFLLIIVLWLTRYIIDVSFHDKKIVQKYVITTLKQYTFWNLCLIFINIFYKNEIFEVFVFVNTTVVFIVYYIFHIMYRDKIKCFPNMPHEFSELDIDIVMFLAHGAPFIYYLYKFVYQSSGYKISHNIGYETAFLNITWSVVCFYSLDPRNSYFNISDEVLYCVWFLMISLHIIIGYLVMK